MLIESRESSDRAVRQLVRELAAELAGTGGVGDATEFMIGLIDGKPVACGGLRGEPGGVGEIDQMYVRPAWRGQGLSRLILAALEERAVELGCVALRLETGPDAGRAIRLYASAGFHSLPGQGDGRVRFEKSLLPALA